MLLDIDKMYWETYDDQDGKDFAFVSYVGLTGERTVVEAADNLASQVAEIRRTNGSNTEVRVYR